MKVYLYIYIYIYMRVVEIQNTSSINII